MKVPPSVRYDSKVEEIVNSLDKDKFHCRHCGRFLNRDEVLTIQNHPYCGYCMAITDNEENVLKWKLEKSE